MLTHFIIILTFSFTCFGFIVMLRRTCLVRPAVFLWYKRCNIPVFQLCSQILWTRRLFEALVHVTTYKRKNNYKEHMNINSILQVLCPPWEQSLLWLSFWGPVHAVRGAAVQNVQGTRCRPSREGSGCQLRFPAGEQPGWPSWGQGTPQHLHSDVSLTHLINTSPHWKQELTCALEETQADSAVARPASDAERAESHCHGLAGVWCCIPFCVPLRKSIVLSGALENIKSLVPVSLSICHKWPKY